MVSHSFTRVKGGVGLGYNHLEVWLGMENLLPGFTDSCGSGQKAHKTREALHSGSGSWLPPGDWCNRQETVYLKIQPQKLFHHAAIFDPNRQNHDPCGMRPHKGTNTQRQGWLGSTCWLDTMCPQDQHLFVRNRSERINYHSMYSFVRQFSVVPSRVLQTVPDGMKSHLPKVLTIKGFPQFPTTHHASWDNLPKTTCFPTLGSVAK